MLQALQFYGKILIVHVSFENMTCQLENRSCNKNYVKITFVHLSVEKAVDLHVCHEYA